MATAPTSVRKAFVTQADLKGHREHCAPAARTLASLGSGPRQQVRISGNGEFALYTVSELLHETTDSVVRMGPAAGGGSGRRRSSRVNWTRRSSLRTCATRTPEMPVSWLRAGRRWLPNAPHRHRPHGGDIEEHTDEQAERVAERLGGWRPPR
jgi:hypothetical protein